MQKRISLDKEIEKKVLKLVPVEYRLIIFNDFVSFFLPVCQFFWNFFLLPYLRKVSENWECRIAQKRISLDEQIKKKFSSIFKRNLG